MEQTTKCRGCGTRVPLRARDCFFCKAPDPVIQSDPADVRRVAAWYVGAVVMVASVAAAILSFIRL
jgi:hypothetical protein